MITFIPQSTPTTDCSRLTLSPSTLDLASPPFKHPSHSHHNPVQPIRVMGAFKDLFKKNSTDQSPSSSPTSPARPHSTLDLDLPRPPQPLWALATEPDLSRHTCSAARRSFGPREPWEKRDGNGRNRTNEPNREGRANEARRMLQRPDGRDRVKPMQELGTGMGDLRLNISTQSRSNPSQPPPFSNPSTPSRPSLTSPSRSTQHGHSSLSAPSASPHQPLQSYPPHPPSRNQN